MTDDDQDQGEEDSVPTAEAPVSTPPEPAAPEAPTQDQPPVASIDVAASPGPPPDNGPVAGVIDVQGQQKQPFDLQGPTTPQDTATYLKQQDPKYANDLINGHIEPKTIQDLYAEKKGLSGKIGTLFGLLVSGAGSGLAHQSNAVLDMMNKQIQNDMDAQKESKTNALTLNKLNQQHQLEETQKTLNLANAHQIQAEANIRADALTHMQMNRTEFHKLAQTVNQLATAAASDPNNVAKQQQLKNAQQALGMIGQGIDAQNANISDRAAAQSALLGATNPPQAGVNDSGVDIKKLNDLNVLGKINSPLGLNGQESSEANKETAQVQDNRATANQFADSFQRLNSLDAGHLTPGVRATELATLQANIARNTTGQYNRAEAIEQAKGLFPEASDLPSVRREKFRKAMEFFKSQEAATPTLDRFKLKTPFPKLSSERDPDEGKTGTIKATGQRMIKKNGQWIPYKGP